MNGFEVSKMDVEVLDLGNWREERLGGEDEIAALFNALMREGVKGVLTSERERWREGVLGLYIFEDEERGTWSNTRFPRVAFEPVSRARVDVMCQ